MVESFGIIYMCHLPNNKKYIGLTTQSLKERIKGHYSKKVNRPFYNYLKKFKKHEVCWKVLDKAENLEDLKQKEIFYIKKYKTFFFENKNGLNLTKGGEGTKGYILNKNQKNILRQRTLEQFSKPENVEKHSQITKNYLLNNPQAKAEHSKRMKKWFQTEVGLNHAKKISKINKQNFKSKKFKIDWLKKRNGILKPFMVFNQNKVHIATFLIQRHCAKFLNIEYRNLNACLKKKRNRCGGYYFKYI